MRAAYIALMSAVPFVKMHGLGNDFVVLDARQRPQRLRVRLGKEYPLSQIPRGSKTAATAIGEH